MKSNFNINEYVDVRLTDVGRDILRKIGYSHVREDAEGWSQWQLWTLMYLFGGFVYTGCDMPFEATIRIGEDE